MTVGIASGSQLSAEAGARVADEGGNAVDAALAAVMAAAVVEPGLCSLGGVGAITIWPPDGPPVTIEGKPEMPGRGLPDEAFGHGYQDVEMAFGAGLPTRVGCGTVATPGMLASCGRASASHGKLPWAEVLAPAYDHAKTCFSMAPAAAAFLGDTYTEVYGWNRSSWLRLTGSSDPPSANGWARTSGLADSLELIAREGPDALYRGELGATISDYLCERGGILTREDLAAYEARMHSSLRVGFDGYSVATNPPPALGGAALAAMLLLLEDMEAGEWDELRGGQLVDAQRFVMEARHRGLDASEDLEAEVASFLGTVRNLKLNAPIESPSTIHVSAVDATGLACAATMSNGFGAGVVVPGTGICLNNSLGEVELQSAFHNHPPGTRMTSNMAPTIARRRDGTVLALGSPGSDRIPSAVLQTMVNHIRLGMPLAEAIDHPRAFVDLCGGRPRVSYEAGMPVGHVDMKRREFDELNLYFGGVAAARWSPKEGISVAGDCRRTGGAAIGGTRPRRRRSLLERKRIVA